jgi:hypothetical protein
MKEKEAIGCQEKINIQKKNRKELDKENSKEGAVERRAENK